nr:AbrB/MazE/SpoVT family DNA-binding domain-containing protein [Candidatus Njordarchaeota archaeon]
MSVRRVGSKGELFLPKEIREKLGLKPNMKIIYRVEGGRLLVEPVHSLEDMLREPQQVQITLKEFRDFRRKLSQEAES